MFVYKILRLAKRGEPPGDAQGEFPLNSQTGSLIALHAEIEGINWEDKALQRFPRLKQILLDCASFDPDPHFPDQSESVLAITMGPGSEKTPPGLHEPSPGEGCSAKVEESFPVSGFRPDENSQMILRGGPAPAAAPPLASGEPHGPGGGAFGPAAGGPKPTWSQRLASADFQSAEDFSPTDFHQPTLALENVGSSGANRGDETPELHTPLFIESQQSSFPGGVRVPMCGTEMGGPPGVGLKKGPCPPPRMRAYSPPKGPAPSRLLRGRGTLRTTWTRVKVLIGTVGAWELTKP